MPSNSEHPIVDAVILAAGKGTRMQSDLPKVMHEVADRPMLHWVIDACRAVGARRIVVVVGHREDLVRASLEGEADIDSEDDSEDDSDADADVDATTGQIGYGHALPPFNTHIPATVVDAASRRHKFTFAPILNSCIKVDKFVKVPGIGPDTLRLFI